MLSFSWPCQNAFDFPQLMSQMQNMIIETDFTKSPFENDQPGRITCEIRHAQSKGHNHFEP